MILGKWDRRISRANELTSSFPFAAEGLRFYSCVATFQKSFYEEIQKALADVPTTYSDRPLRDELDLFLLLPKFSGFLSMVEQIAPAPLAKACAVLEQKGPAEWQRAIEDFWYTDPELDMSIADTGSKSTDGRGETYSSRLLAWIFLQPYAEYLADHSETKIVDGTPSTCPLCGCKPIVGVLRSEGDGAKKSLVCMLC